MTEETRSAGSDSVTEESSDEVLGDRSAEELVSAVAEILREAKPVRLSMNVLLPRDEMLAALDEAIASLPDELRSARWLLKEREEYLAVARQDAADIVSEAAAQAEQMVRRTELSRQSEIYSRRIRDEAEAEARHRRRQTEDYCEQRLAQFELTLGKIGRAVQQGRERLSALPSVESDEPHEGRDAAVIDLTDERVAGGQMLFDQDTD